jgi:hypothetical protein
MFQKIPALTLLEFSVGPFPVQQLADRVGQLPSADAAAGAGHFADQSYLLRGELPSAKLSYLCRMFHAIAPLSLFHSGAMGECPEKNEYRQNYSTKLTACP